MVIDFESGYCLYHFLEMVVYLTLLSFPWNCHAYDLPMLELHQLKSLDIDPL